MKIGDRVFVHGYIDEIRRDTVIVRNKGGYFGTDPGEVIVAYNSAHPNWIPVSERLPEEPNIYTVTDSKGDVVRFVYTGTDSSRKYWLRCAKAWMPLPEPYKEDSE